MKDDELPDVLAALIEQVVRGTRLWPAEKRDVSAELESHFRDGLQQLAEEGLSEPEAVTLLRECFGDPNMAAKLIRRGKKRNRSMAWKIFVRTTCVLAVLIGVTTAYAGWLVFGEANPTVDYISKMNEPIDAIPATDRAWPIWKEVFLDLNPMPKELASQCGGCVGCGRLPVFTAENDLWETAMAWVESNRHLIPNIQEAAAKKAYGKSYETAESIDFIIALDKRRGELKRVADFTENRERYEANRQLLAVLLPDLAEARTVAKLLILDARGHLANGDFDAAWQSLESAHRLGIQLLATRRHLIEQLIGLRMTNLAGEGMRQALYEHRDQLTAQKLDRLRTSLASIENTNQTPLNYIFEEYTYKDVVQYAFTDDGNGDGVLTPGGFKEFIGISNGDAPEERNLWAENATSLAVAAVHAGRKETLAKFAEFWEMNKKRFSLPLYDPEWQRAEEDYKAFFADPLMKARFALVGALMPSVKRADMLGRESAMNRQATLVVLSLLRYRADHGRYPDRLDVLVPDYLDQVPEDVFWAGGLKYALGDDGEILLYSVGGNLIDDGGSSAKLTEDAAFAKVNDPADVLYWPPNEH